MAALDSDVASLEALEAALADNPYVLRYRAKLSALKESDVETYRKRLALIQQQQRAPPAASAPPAPAPTPVALAQGVDLQKLAQLDATSIGELWRARYSTSPGCVSAAIPGATWRGMARRAAESPLFLYPLPQEDSWALYVGQWRGRSLLVTPLADYQRCGAGAEVVVVLQHFDELLESHDLCLMLGGATKAGAPPPLDARELQLLAYLVQHFHTAPEGLELLTRFNATPGERIHLEICAEVKRACAPSEA